MICGHYCFGCRNLQFWLGALLLLSWGGTRVVAQETAGAKSTPDLTKLIKAADGFSVEAVYEIPREFGSWVSLASEKDGRLVASDQYGKLYRITPNPDANKTQVEALPVEIGRAQGLLYAFDRLYVMAHPGDGQAAGLYQLQDTTGDDQYDSVQLILPINGEGEHGPHAIVLSPDKQSLYICAGNHTDLPEITASALPRTWDEDQVLPRLWDAGGHAVGKMAPGGWICQVDPDGGNLKLIAAGFRNEYDIAFDANGELFTYDADMEWDIGTPWYRPTRVNHVVSGAEFGWRSGTGKWPSVYPDSLGSVIDIGPGSPTGITFGTGAKFPEKYQRALFICDWSYGIIYAIHLTPAGSTFTAEAERFCSAPAMQVADLCVLPSDGNLYFVVGGRKTQSVLYRIKSTDSAATVAATAVALPSAFADRHRLEQWHQPLESTALAASAIEQSLTMLDSNDRNLRYAARIAIEHQDPTVWQTHLASTTDTQTLLELSLAAVRGKLSDQKENIIGRLSGLDWSTLSAMQQVHLLRVYGLASVRFENFSAQDWSAIVKQIGPHFPSGNSELDRELCRVLVAAGDAETTAKTVTLLQEAATQEAQIHYALCLANAKTGWQAESRLAYFRWYLDSVNLRGGNSFGGFLRNIRQQAIDNIDMAALPPAEQQVLQALIATQPTPANPQSELEARAFVNKWSLEEILPLAERELINRDFENGKKMFAITQCYKCHRFAGDGGMIGPDLSAVGRRMNKHDLVQSLVDPSEVVSDQYQATMFQLVDGRVVTGRVANLNGDSYLVQEDMLDPGRLSGISVNDIEAMKPSPNSMMPSGLLDTLTQDDILDLLAYLRSGGDRSFEEFAENASPQESETPSEASRAAQR